jgi:hypothetical protein
MKKFILSNWYKLMIASSLLMASFGFMVYSVNSATAKGSNGYSNIPVNADGSITIKLSQEQLKALTPDIQKVNIAEINGHTAAVYSAYTLAGDSYYSLGVNVSNPW